MGQMEDEEVERVLNAKPLGVVCEKCGSDKITKISYGLPAWLNVDEPVDPRIQELLEERLIVRGGCTIFDDSPKYFCRECKYKFGIADKPKIDEKVLEWM